MGSSGLVGLIVNHKPVFQLRYRGYSSVMSDETLTIRRDTYVYVCVCVCVSMCVYKY